MAKVSLIGLGPMGAALAEALIAVGHEVTLWNRSPGKAPALVRAEHGLRRILLRR